MLFIEPAAVKMQCAAHYATGRWASSGGLNVQNSYRYHRSIEAIWGCGSASQHNDWPPVMGLLTRSETVVMIWGEGGKFFLQTMLKFVVLQTGVTHQHHTSSSEYDLNLMILVRRAAVICDKFHIIAGPGLLEREIPQHEAFVLESRHVWPFRS